MSAPETDPPLQLVPVSPAESKDIIGSRRALAAIVFTDTANFSVLMKRDEERALKLVDRDLVQMRAICAEYGGQVLKSTGDGLLMLFTSVVQAVSCGLEIQRIFLERNRNSPSPERLQHRIGIHLGDVFQQGGDVMGDGVNIAARLQTESAAGGICISNTVYDVVQNRVKLVVTRHGPRKLKNVGTVIAYQIFPLNSRWRYFAFFWRFMPARRQKSTLHYVVALSITTFFLVLAFWQRDDSPDDPLQEIAAQLGPIGQPLESEDREHFFINFSEKDNDPEANPPPFPAPGKVAATAEDFYLARYDDMKTYDFTGMTAWLEKYDAQGADEAKMIAVCRSLSGLLDWCEAQLQHYSASAPLAVHDDLERSSRVKFVLDDHEKSDFDVQSDLGVEDYLVWPAPSGGIIYKTSTAEVTLARDQIPPSMLAAIAAVLIREKSIPNTSATQELWRGLDYFISTYQVKASSRWIRQLHELRSQVEPSQDKS